MFGEGLTANVAVKADANASDAAVSAPATAATAATAANATEAAAAVAAATVSAAVTAASAASAVPAASTAESAPAWLSLIGGVAPLVRFLGRGTLAGSCDLSCCGSSWSHPRWGV